MIGNYIITFIRWSTLAKSCVLMDNLKQRNINLKVFNLGLSSNNLPMTFCFNLVVRVVSIILESNCSGL